MSQCEHIILNEFNLYSGYSSRSQHIKVSKSNKQKVDKSKYKRVITYKILVKDSITLQIGTNISLIYIDDNHTKISSVFFVSTLTMIYYLGIYLLAGMLGLIALLSSTAAHSTMENIQIIFVCLFLICFGPYTYFKATSPLLNKLRDELIYSLNLPTKAKMEDTEK